MSVVTGAVLTRCTVGRVEAIVDDDRGLLERMGAGDERALEIAYDRYSGLVFGLARRVINDEQLAGDITQDVFTSLWEHPDRVDLARGSLKVWLGMVTHRRAVDSIRSSERRRAREHRFAVAEPLVAEGAEHEVTEAAGGQWQESRLRGALCHLSDDQRTALELAYFGGCSYREVAARLSIPEGTAKSRLRLALAQLRNLLNDETLAWT